MHYDAHIIFVGDYLDRGPSIKDLIEFLINPIDIDATCHFLMGNHEEAALKFMLAPKESGRWLVYGGYETLSSYAVDITTKTGLSEDKEKLARDFIANMPADHLNFLKQLKSSVTIDDFMFVHAGVSPAHPLDQQDTRDMYWIRAEFLDHEGLYEKIIVHGHTIVPQVTFKINRIGIDTGAFESNCLSCVKLVGNQKDVIHT
jgi:serine/threonine protein phosphatase 1